MRLCSCFKILCNALCLIIRSHVLISLILYQSLIVVQYRNLEVFGHISGTDFRSKTFQLFTRCSVFQIWSVEGLFLARLVFFFNPRNKFTFRNNAVRISSQILLDLSTHQVRQIRSIIDRFRRISLEKRGSFCKIFNRSIKGMLISISKGTFLFESIYRRVYFWLRLQ